jgi:2-keto-3-deoxy-L-rhamnonate aldolase RhmA
MTVNGGVELNRVARLVRIPGPNAAPGTDMAVPWGAWIKPILDMGADGVILPQVRTAAGV